MRNQTNLDGSSIATSSREVKSSLVPAKMFRLRRLRLLLHILVAWKSQYVSGVNSGSREDSWINSDSEKTSGSSYEKCSGSASLSTRVPPSKTLFWACKLESKYNVTCDASHALTKNGGSTLRFGPKGPPKSSVTPHHQGRNFKTVVQSSSYDHSKAFETNRLEMNQSNLFLILLNIFTLNRTTYTVFFSSVFVKYW